MTRLSALLRSWMLAAVVFTGLTLCVGSSAFAQSPIPYGEPISLEHAKKVIAAAEVEAKQNNWPVAIAVVDGSGFLVAFQRLDNTQLGSVEVALEKAKTSALFRRPTKVFEEMLVTGGANLKVLKLPGALPIEGGTADREGRQDHRCDQRLGREVERRWTGRHGWSRSVQGSTVVVDGAPGAAGNPTHETSVSILGGTHGEPVPHGRVNVCGLRGSA